MKPTSHQHQTTDPSPSTAQQQQQPPPASPRTSPVQEAALAASHSQDTGNSNSNSNDNGDYAAFKAQIRRITKKYQQQEAEMEEQWRMLLGVVTEQQQEIEKLVRNVRRLHDELLKDRQQQELAGFEE